MGNPLTVADVILKAQSGLPELMFAGVVALVAAGTWAFWAVSLPMAVFFWLLAVVTTFELYYDLRWSLAFRKDGLHLRRWGPDRFVPWKDVAFVRTDPSWAEKRGTVITVGAKRGTRSPEMRFLVSRLDPRDRRRLGHLFAERGFPLEVGST